MKFALIGETLSYSLSKKLHSIFYKEANVNAYYENYELSRKNFDNFLKKDIYQLNGANITIPYKEDVIKYMHKVSDEAKELNSVNTVVVKNNMLFGYNTDILGFSLMLEYENVSFENKEVVILGTGATANMVKYYAKKNKAKDVKLVSRTKGKGDLTYSDHIKGDIIINTTPLGVKGKNSNSPVDETVVKRFQTIIDINYNPYRSKFLEYGIYNNKKVVSGLYMLVAQGILAENLFFDKDFGREIINEVYYKLMSEKNIVLIGLTGSGKTSVGRLLGQALNRRFIDLDKKIARDNNMTVEGMFNVSENFFRKREHKALASLSNRKGIVIATGGGVVENEKNMNLLYKNSIVICIERDVKEIANTISLHGRPLLVGNTEEKLKKTYNKRKDLYDKYSEIKVVNNGVENCVGKILKLIEVENGSFKSKL